MTRSSEYLKSRTYDGFYYGLVFVMCLCRLQSPRALLKANYGVRYGGSALASKYGFQDYIGQDRYAPCAFVPQNLTLADKTALIIAFAAEHNWPVVLKPDKGFVGKGIFILKNADGAQAARDAVCVDYMLQKFVPGTIEFGLFYARHKGVVSVPSINRKLFPAVMGDGVSTVLDLAKRHPRYSSYWEGFLKNIDRSVILPSGQERTLSFIGSNTLGSKFTDDTHLATDAIRARLADMFEDAPGYNFGRLDVKAKSVEAFQAGEFDVIETNGMMSLPTNMLDPDLSVWAAAKIWHRHAKLFVNIAREHRAKPMETLSLFAFIRRSLALIRQVERQQDFAQAPNPKAL